MSTPFKIYIGQITQDERGPYVNSSYHSTYAAAEKSIKGTSWYGGDGNLKEGLAVTLPNGKTYLIEEIDLDNEAAQKKAALRKQALTKLTDEERTALGIK